MDGNTSFRTLFDQANDPIVVYAVDGEGRPGRFLEVNQAAVERYGYSRDLLLEMRPSDLIAAEYDYQQPMKQLYQQTRLVVETLHITADGRRIPIEVSAHLFEIEGEPTALCIYRDISDRNRIEDNLRHANDILEHRVAERTALAEQQTRQLRRLASELTRVEQKERQRLAKVLHDDLQQVLVGVKFHLDMFPISEPCERIQERITRIQALIEQAIYISRSLTTQLSPPILSDAGLPAALEWLQRWTQNIHGLRVKVEADPGANPEAEEMRLLLFEAARELLLNVVKHARVTEAEVKLTLLENGQVELCISDEGKGFDPRPESELQPSGFGLTSLRERLRHLGGSLDVHSTRGDGTRVSLTVPRTLGYNASGGENEMTPPDPEAMDRPAPRQCGIQVLLADDHKIVREGLAAMLEHESDLEVVGEAADGEEAIDMARQLQPTVIVMDVSMPRMNGIEATRRIKEDAPAIQIVGLSMHEKDDVAAALYKAGASTFLTKGGPAADLINAVRDPEGSGQ